MSNKVSLKSRLLSGGAWAFSGRIISSVATLGANVLLARLLSPEAMGTYFLAFSAVSIFVIIAQWGLGKGVVKLIASEMATENAGRAAAAVKSAFSIVIIVSLVLSALIYSPAGRMFLSKVSGADMLASIAGVLCVWMFALALQSIVRESFRGYHDIRMASIFGGMLTAIFSVLLYLYAWGYSEKFELIDAVQIMVLATSINLIIGGMFLKKKIGRSILRQHTEISKVFVFGVPLMLTNIALFATRELHIWILAFYKPETEVALYGASLRLILLLALPLLIINAVIPSMVADMYSQKQYQRVQNLLQKTASIIIVPAIFAFIIIVVYGAEILGLVYGSSYAEAYMPFVILAFGQLINVLTGSPGILLTMSGHERVAFKTALFSSVLGLITSLIGAQLYGANGAAAGYTVGIITNNMAMSIYCWNKLSIRTYGNIMLLVPMIKNFKYR